MGPYEKRYGCDGKYYIDGPCPGGECSYYGGTLYGQFRWDDETLVLRIAELMNVAYRQGYNTAKHDIRKALGI